MQGTKAAMRQAILSGIRMPRIGTKRLEAVPDAERLQTAQLQAAIDALSAAGGGTLVFPAGIYRTGALRLKSGVELQLASPQTEIRFTPEEPERNYPLVFSHWEASPCRNYSALLYACDAHDIAVTGSGTLDGGADRDHWWNWHHQVEESWSENRPDLQRADRSALRRMNEEGVPIPDRIFGGGHFLRPNFVQFLRCERVLLQGVTLHNSPMWQLNPVQCRSVIVEQIMFCDSVMDTVHGAAIHGTMLYEDGRNGTELPVFRDITIENITAHGGEYGIFLEAFPEVPLTGLTLRNIRIDGVRRPLRSMNWKDAAVENVVINGKPFPRPGAVRILGVPRPGEPLEAWAECSGTCRALTYEWETSRDGSHWKPAGNGSRFTPPHTAKLVRVWAVDEAGSREHSIPYRVLHRAASSEAAARLYCRGMLEAPALQAGERPVTCGTLAEMLLPLCDAAVPVLPLPGCTGAVSAAAANRFFPREAGGFSETRSVFRQEMATVAMQACGVDYRNASSTMPVCADADEVAPNYGTNAARALYFGFLTLDAAGRFAPHRQVTRQEAAEILNRVADFAGL